MTPPHRRLIRLMVLAVLPGLAGCDSPTNPPPPEPRLLITRDDGGNRDIYSIRPDGTDAVRLTSESAAEVCARWSPDRRRIAYVSNRDSVPAGTGWGRPGAVYVMRADGSHPVRVTTPIANFGTGCPDWSADGRRLVYDRWSADTRTFSLYLIDPDGSGETRLTSGAGDDFGARWSPDGSRIAFVTNESVWTAVALVDPSGGNRTRVPNPCPNSVYDVAWSPDGARLAVTCHGSFGPEVHTMRVDGSDPVRVSAPTGHDAPGTDATAVWSPDGSRLAISRFANGSIDVFTVGLAGQAPVRVTQFAGNEFPSDWR